MFESYNKIIQVIKIITIITITTVFNTILWCSFIITCVLFRNTPPLNFYYYYYYSSFDFCVFLFIYFVLHDVHFDLFLRLNMLNNNMHLLLRLECCIRLVNPTIVKWNELSWCEIFLLKQALTYNDAGIFQFLSIHPNTSLLRSLISIAFEFEMIPRYCVSKNS